MEEKKYVSISLINKAIKNVIDAQPFLNKVYLKGEISNFKGHTRGHLYFTLKDESSRISAVMFASAASSLTFTPADGMNVLVEGRISVYEANGGYQIYVDKMDEDGIGNLYLEYEKLKKKLASEGLFDEKHKLPIPKYPNTIGIITAPTGAAVRDIISTIKRRYPLSQTILFPTLVQGELAKDNIVKQIETAQNYDLDLIICGRGGGSIEDLWAFNEEPVIEAVFNSNTPVISAVGHETDFTITDFVADLRAPTPSAAAELAVSDISVTQSRIEGYMELLNQLMERKLYMYRSQLENKKLKLEHLSPMTILDSRRHQLIQTGQRMENAMNNILLSRKHQLEIYASKLHGLSPLEKLSQGYSYVESIQGKPVNSVKNIDAGDKVKIYFKDGNVDAQVLEVNNGKISDN